MFAKQTTNPFLKDRTQNEIVIMYEYRVIVRNVIASREKWQRERIADMKEQMKVTFKARVELENEQMFVWAKCKQLFVRHPSDKETEKIIKYCNEVLEMM